MKTVRVLLIAAACVLFSGAAGWCSDYIHENDPTALESSARYNYHLGEYYFAQGDFEVAEQYFERSRDMMSRREAITADRDDIAMLEIRPEPARGAPGEFEYVIADGDVLYISVWENDDLEQEVVVRPDGRISFPLVGDLVARGHTIVELDETLTGRLKEYIRAPEVSISIRKLGGSKVIILGEVGRPGVYAVSGSKTVLEAVALTGGFRPDAVVNSVVLIRGGFENPQIQRLNLKRPLLRGRDLAQNVALKSEDIIFVPRTFIADLSRVMAQVLDPISRGAVAAEIMGGGNW